MDTFIKNLKRCLKKKEKGRINWRGLAKKTNVPKSTLHRIFEERRYPPQWETLIKIMNYAGCEITCEKQKKGDCMQCIGSYSKKAA